MNPQCPDGYFGKGVACLKLGIQDGINHYEEALHAMRKIYEEEKAEGQVYESSHASKFGRLSAISSME